MGAKQELWEYFMNHTTGRRSLKGAVHGIIAITIDVDEEIIDLILKRLKERKLNLSSRVARTLTIHVRNFIFCIRSRLRIELLRFTRWGTQLISYPASA